MANQTTDILSLPMIMPSQAQKHVTHNEALGALDVLVQAVVAGRAAEPPPAPEPGARLIVGEDPAGAFAGRANAIAAFRDGAWTFLAPKTGWIAYDETLERLVVFAGAAWRELAPPRAPAGIETLGINGQADETNRLVVASPASLFTHEGGDHRVKIDKAGASDTASLVYQTAYSGRAEMGLTGSDDFALKVSADGAVWHEAMRIDRASGRVRFPAGGTREMLDGERTYHVASGGNDAASGLDPQSAFATLQRAINAALALDANGHAVTIALADGTHAGAAMSRPMFDGGTLAVRGNAAAPQSVVIDGGAGPALYVDAAGAKLQASGVKLAGQIGVWARYGALVFIRGNVAFGPVTERHVGADNGAYVEIVATVEIAGDAKQHLFASENGHVLMIASIVTLADTPHFPDGFAVARTAGLVSAYGNSYSGSATGVRYRVSGNGVIFTNGGGAMIFPGNAAGVATSGGQYE